MPNTTSAKKAARQSKKRNETNRRVEVSLRTSVKKAKRAIEQSDPEEAQKVIRFAISELDHATHRGYIHRNTAARRKSRLMKRLNALTPEVEPKKSRARTKPQPPQ